MGEKIKAVMVYDRPEPSEELRKTLQILGMEIHHVRSCLEAWQLFKGANQAELVFTDTELPDGRWEDILLMAQHAQGFLPVVVVTRTVDMDLYLKALGAGAFDLVTPPFLSVDLVNIAGNAMYQKLSNRDIAATHVA